MLRDQSGLPQCFMVATEAGLSRVDSLRGLLTALARVGVPVVFPAGEWPGYEAADIA